MAASRKRGMFIGMAAAVAAGLLTIVGMSFALRTSTGCGELTGEASEAPASHALVIELAGNSESQQQEVREFVASRLASTGSNPTETLVVEVGLVRYGEPVTAKSECLKRPMVLTPNEDDVATYTAESTAESTKEQILADLQARREEQISWVEDAVVAEVATTSFDGLDPESPVFSPLAVWDVAHEVGATGEGSEVSLLTPLVSTADDCLTQPGETAEDVLAAVQGCIQTNQLAPLDSGQTSIEIALSNGSEPGRQAAALMKSALCEAGTADNCSGGS